MNSMYTYLQIHVKTIFGMQEIYRVCLYVGVLIMFDTLVL